MREVEGVADLVPEERDEEGLPERGEEGEDESEREKAPVGEEKTSIAHRRGVAAGAPVVNRIGVVPAEFSRFAAVTVEMSLSAIVLPRYRRQP
ncbi:MAG: hypothetical protein IH804_01675 [Planctomycetes bacterium]|nr:hypothetical protein [Planctomycetota bacterium]